MTVVRAAQLEPIAKPLTEDQRFNLLCRLTKEYQKGLEAKQAAAAEHARICKRAKTEYGEDALEAIKDLIALQTPDGEKRLLADIARRKWIGKNIGSSIHAQLELFPEDRTPADDRAFAIGRYHGVAGEPANPPYEPNSSQYHQYMNGYHDGQASILRDGITILKVVPGGETSH